MNLIPATNKELKTCSGIVYGILNKTTGKWYLGQTIHTFYSRYPGGRFWKYPTNPYMRRVYKKYKIEAFETYLFCKNVKNTNTLDELEKLTISKYNSIYPNGYNFENGGQRYNKRVNNVSKIRMSETHLKRRAKKRILWDKDEKRHVFYNISTFAEKHGLDGRTVSMLLSDRVKRYFGWHKFGVNLEKPFKHSKKYRIIGPDGKSHSFYNGSEFARIHGLTNVGLYNVLNGKNIYHRGFHLKNPRKIKLGMPIGCVNNKKRKYSRITLKKRGCLYKIYNNILEFCKKQNIDKRGIYTLMNGEQKTYHGFRLVSFKYCDQYLKRNPKKVAK